MPSSRIARQLLLAACVEVQRLSHGGAPGVKQPTNIDEHGRFYPDGTQATRRDFLFPEQDYDEGELLAREVAQMLKLEVGDASGT